MGDGSPKKASGLRGAAQIPQTPWPKCRRFFLPVWRWESKLKVPAEPLSVRTPRLADGVCSHSPPAAGPQDATRTETVWSLPPPPSEADVNPNPCTLRDGLPHGLGDAGLRQEEM